MGRNPRIEFEGAVYHVMSRGNRRNAVFLDDKDCEVFIQRGQSDILMFSAGAGADPVADTSEGWLWLARHNLDKNTVFHYTFPCESAQNNGFRG